MTARKVAVIGSFRRFYPQILDAMAAFARESLAVTSPTGAAITREGEFVRFASDPQDWSNREVQTATLVKMFAADIVFAVAPGGYVGRTTCYEIGRLCQARKPVVFSDVPHDLPIACPATHVMPAAALARRLAAGETIAWVHESGDDFDAQERRLAARADTR